MQMGLLCVIARDTEMYIIKTYNPNHTCPRVNRNKFVTSKWLTKPYPQQFKDSESWSVANFMNRVQKDYVMECNRVNAHRAKKTCNKIIEGSFRE